jgi:hypothetical protein
VSFDEPALVYQTEGQQDEKFRTTSAKYEIDECVDR